MFGSIKRFDLQRKYSDAPREIRRPEEFASMLKTNPPAKFMLHITLHICEVSGLFWSHGVTLRSKNSVYQCIHETRVFQKSSFWLWCSQKTIFSDVKLQTGPNV